MSLLVDLETARRERSVLLSDKPKTTGERKEKGVCEEYQIGFYETLTKPRMNTICPGLGKRGLWRQLLDLMCRSVQYQPSTWECSPVSWRWCGDDVVAPPPHILMRSLSSTSRSQTQSGLITRIMSDLCQAHQKYPFTVRSIIGLQHSPPWMKYHGLNEENTFIGKIISLWVEWSVRVVSLDTNNLTGRSLVRVENKLDEGKS